MNSKSTSCKNCLYKSNSASESPCDICDRNSRWKPEVEKPKEEGKKSNNQKYLTED